MATIELVMSPEQAARYWKRLMAMMRRVRRPSVKIRARRRMKPKR